MAITHHLGWINSPNAVNSATSNQLNSTAVATGDIIVGCLACNASLLTSIVDSSGGTFTILPAFGPLGGARNTNVVVFYQVNTTNTSRTITANFSSATYSTFMADSFSGCATGTPYDFNCTQSALGTGTAVASGSMPVATSFPNSVEVAYAIMDLGAGSATWSAQQISGVGAGGLGNTATTAISPPIEGFFKVESASAAYNATVTNALSGNWFCIVVSFSNTNIPQANIHPAFMPYGFQPMVAQ